MKTYKIWATIEEHDHETDEYQDVHDEPVDILGVFESKELAEAALATVEIPVAVAYDYSKQKWVEGKEAEALNVQCNADLKAVLNGPRAAEYCKMMGTDLEFELTKLARAEREEAEDG